MKDREKVFSKKSLPQSTARVFESILACKWSLTVYQLLGHGINRPGAMVRSVEGLSTKVLNDCLKRNLEFGILKRIAYNEVPPRVEYEITDYGRRFIDILSQLEALELTPTAATTAESSPGAG